ncbi:MAG: TonB-dependent vitamin B12 receptor [Gallionella sp.]|nr:TonB-dependent vitamin B12 receptor [Gallionella sp.]
MQIKSNVFAAMLCAVSSVVHAATDETLGELVVTATRTAQAADASLASVTVITRQDIEQLQAHSLPEVLRGTAGLTISNSGGAGKATSVFLRGTNADHVLVLVDGIKIGSATLGTASFQNIPVAQIERIEIVRGPRASLYGSEAIGGVIQIFTRRSAVALTQSASFTTGSYGTYNTALGLSRGGDQGWFNARLNQQNTGGFNAKRNVTGADLDKDGYHNSSLGLSGGYRFDNGITADAQALRANSKNQYDGNPNEAKGVQQVLGGALRFSPAQDWNMTVRAGSSRDESNNYLNGVFKSSFKTQRDSLSWQNDFAVNADDIFTAGMDYQNDRVDSATLYARTTRSNNALFGQYHGVFGRSSVQASARRDDNQQFGGHTTTGLGYGYALSNDTRLTASYGTAFKAPTFNQLYYPGFGSATLRPELSRSVELGVAGRLASGKWSVNVYQTDITDLIGFDANFIPVNINTALLTGVEGQMKAQLSDWDIATTLTWQDPRQTSGGNSGKLLNRRAMETLRVEIARQFGEVRVASSLYGEGRRYDDLANTSGKKLGGYGLLDVRAEYRLDRVWSMQGRIDNLLDKQYETAQYFNQARRAVYVTLNFQSR